MQILLQECREKLDADNRNFGTIEWLSYLKTAKPSWIASAKGLLPIFKQQKNVLSQGRLTWGCTLQANSLLFEDGQDNCPAACLYSTDEEIAVDVDELARVADRLYALKDDKDLPEEYQEVADCIKAESHYQFAYDIPKSLSPNIALRMTTIFVNRKHLPDSKLSERIYPLLVYSGQVEVAMILPSRFWTDDLIDRWGF